MTFHRKSRRPVVAHGLQRCERGFVAVLSSTLKSWKATCQSGQGALGRQNEADGTDPRERLGCAGHGEVSKALRDRFQDLYRRLSGRARAWTGRSSKGGHAFTWPREGNLTASSGAGKPWMTVQSLAAIPLKNLSSGVPTGLREKSHPLRRRTQTGGARDLGRVRLDLEAQSIKPGGRFDLSPLSPPREEEERARTTITSALDHL